MASKQTYPSRFLPQGDEAASTFRIAALRASKVHNQNWICDQSDYFSPILRHHTTYGDTCAPNLSAGTDDFETLIGDFVISDFEPHCPDNESECDGCDDALACPGS